MGSTRIEEKGRLDLANAVKVEEELQIMKEKNRREKRESMVKLLMDRQKLLNEGIDKYMVDKLLKIPDPESSNEDKPLRNSTKYFNIIIGENRNMTLKVFSKLIN